MRLLFDQNLSFRLVRELNGIFAECAQVARQGLANAHDQEVWQFAKDRDFILVSQDADFAEMALLRGPPPKVIWLRCGNRPTDFVADLLRRHRDSIHQFGLDPVSACLELYA